MDPQIILAEAQDALSARRVFGEPIHTDGLTIIPVAVVGGGGGGGATQDRRDAVGFGIKARPAGVFVVRNGDVRWRPAVDLNRVILGGQLVGLFAVLTFGRVMVRWLSRRSA